MTEPENLLSKVPGTYVALSHKDLPDAYTATEECMQTVLEVPHLGTLRFYHQRYKHKRGKLVTRFWVTEKAEAI